MSNETAYDSDRAIEVQLSDKEFEDLQENNKMLPRRSKDSLFISSKPTSGESNLEKRYIDECIKPRANPNDKRKKFHTLVKLLKDKNVSKRLWGTIDRKTRITIQEVHEIELEYNVTHLEEFHLEISDVDMYSEENSVLDSLMGDLENMSIVHVEEKEGGTQLKLIITFEDGSQALMKPMRFDRHRETLPNHFYFVDYERHNSEIAAFHLDRILGFRRCPPVVGRKLNITTEIYAVAEDELIKTFFVSPAQNLCFHGHCSYYCDTGHAICGSPDTLEVSLAAFLPPDSLSGRKSWKNPWRRSYHKRRKARWETEDNYCETVREKSMYNNTKRLADLVDTTILDFLIGNMDRHHYETFKIFGNESFILHLDHGRGFGKANHDELSILAPLYQCCFIHITTFHRLLQLQLNPMKLSSLMRCSLYKDPLNPVLLDSHLEALDRRLEIVLNVLHDCIKKNSVDSVFFYDKGVDEEKNIEKL
ncbi:hypothetical protein JTE90_001330 [Oedothorax gibbosus]|uniref:FAM20 C-terminal domain-containing protein n=1 Tax=Oedothorax gibbosus TaxID=931172 RepID=A0AAV6V3M9_9ARAC|nr:hypothetical protein JTE90_001330 [Oedothorax gibbosus]